VQLPEDASPITRLLPLLSLKTLVAMMQQDAAGKEGIMDLFDGDGMSTFL
jgi:hypothetical protein